MIFSFFLEACRRSTRRLQRHSPLPGVLRLFQQFECALDSQGTSRTLDTVAWLGSIEPELGPWGKAFLGKGDSEKPLLGFRTE